MFKDNKILLVHENNETWLLPCCWCDVLESVKSNTIKKEESGKTNKEQIEMCLSKKKNENWQVQFD